MFPLDEDRNKNTNKVNFEENLKKKREKEDHLTMKTQTEISQEKEPNKNKKIEKETHEEYSEKQRRVKRRCYTRIMHNIINARKMTSEEMEKYIKSINETLPLQIKSGDTVMD